MRFWWASRRTSGERLKVPPLRARRFCYPGTMTDNAAGWHSSRQLAYSDATIEHLAVQDPRVPRLRSVPSIGPVTAAAFLAAIDDAQRFPHAHQLEAYLGLVPREYSSGETQRRGAITKAGHSRTRWLLIQAAVSILRRRPPQAEELRTWALRIAARRGKQVAVVALARRLAGILYALLRDGSVFEPQRVRPPRRPAAAAAARGHVNRVDAALTMRALVSRRFDGWVSANVDLAAVAGPLRRWRPHPSNPLCADGLTGSPLMSANRRLTEPRETHGHGRLEREQAEPRHEGGTRRITS